MSLRWVLVPLVLAGAASLAGAAAWQLAHVGVHQGYEPEQPLAFSHKLHAGDSQIPCLYCHFGARRSRHAGIPPANVCMNCHALLGKQSVEIERLKEAVELQRPLSWVQVHKLPDYVYFNHSQHVLSDVACQECHGPVETMSRVLQVAPLTMGWCLECHKKRAAKTRLQTAAVTAPQANLDCGKCHY